MAEMTIRPEEIRDALASFAKSYDPGVATRDEVGTVTEAGDGIARIEGLPSTMANELLKFENGTLALALNLDVREVGAVILGDTTGIEEGPPMAIGVDHGAHIAVLGAVGLAVAVDHAGVAQRTQRRLKAVT